MQKKTGFSLLELTFVIIIIGILSYAIFPFFTNNKLPIAEKNLINNFLIYKNIANNNNNYQIIPQDNNTTSKELVKYWFKTNLEFVFQYKNGYLYYYYFKDLPNKNPNKNFDLKLTNINEIYNNNGQYYIGVSKQEMNNSNIYPDKQYISPTFNLTNYNIKQIKICTNNKNCQTIPDNITKYNLIYFNNNIFLKEGKSGDAGDTEILDNSRQMLKPTQTLNITLISNNGKQTTLNINSNGLITQ